VYECPEVPVLTNWTLAQEADVPALPSTSTSRPHTYAAPTPTQVSGTLAADASLVANALQQQQQQPPLQRGAGGREADGGWSVSWCKEQYWGEVLATCSGMSGVVKVFVFTLFLSQATQGTVVDHTIVPFASSNHSSFARSLPACRLWTNL
jgi:nucleoporin SEH1